MAKIVRELGAWSKREEHREQNARRWAERTRSWRESGQTQAAYCEAHGLSVWMLRKWIVDLGARGQLSKSGPRLLPIVLHPGRTGVHGGVHGGAAALVPQAREHEAGLAELEIALPNGSRIRAAGVSATELTRAIARVLRC